MRNLEKFTETKSLALRHANLMQEREQLPPGSEVSPAKKKEAEALEVKLRKILYKSLSSDVLPVNSIAAVISRPAEKKVEKKVEKKAMIVFHFEVSSSMKTLIDRFKVEAYTKDEAWKQAEKIAMGYPGDVKLKIS